MTEQDFSSMSTEQRFKQIEVLLSTAAKTINRTGEQVREQENRLARLEESGLDLQVQLASATRLLTETITAIRRMEERSQIRHQEHQAEIERSQAEIERIWQYLMSRSGNGNAPQ